MRMLKIAFFVCFSAFLHYARATSNQVAELSQGFSSFPSRFYQECAKSKPGNVIISPLSVANVLALLSFGAKGKTYQQLRSGLHLTDDKDLVANEFHEYYDLLKKSAGDATLSIANQIYVQKNLQLSKSFQDVARTKFLADVESLDFAESDESAKVINQNVEEKTSRKIKDFIKPGVLTSDTVAVLVNAIYFKGAWEQKFDKENTREANFHVSETEKIPVDFMYIESSFNFVSLDDLEAKAVEMKYDNSSLSFVILLPNSRTGLPGLESILKNYNFNRDIGLMDGENLHLSVPKFKVEYEIELKDVLTKMGMGEMFSDNADLSGLLEGSGDLKVSHALHKAFIEIDEDGATAGAASAAVTSNRSFGSVEFLVDHPFLYFIRDSQTNSIIFSGRVERP